MPAVRTSLPAAPAPEPVLPSPLDDPGLACATVAHDFNNLLSVINVCAGEIAADAENRVQLERVEEIRDAARRGAELTRRLLASTGGAAPDPHAAPVAVEAAIVDALPLLRRTLPASTDLSVSSAGCVPRAMLGPGELERMLLNLASNSRDALGAGGRVAIRTALAPIAPGDPVLPVGWSARITFSDDGEGMTPEVAARAIDPLYTTKPAEDGSGLGLATVQAIARGRGGDVRINSSPGRGTTVSIYLPAVRASGAPLALARNQSSRPI
jgi:two-component system cell cycle sensor histidine kinase/response regulator CckA